MGDYQTARTSFTSRGITLNSLKDQLHSLNMRMLLAMQNHNEETQEELKKQMADVQKDIDRMILGSGHHDLKL